MAASSFSEVLQPLAARLPKVVREHEILRVSATVEGDDREASQQIVVAEMPAHRLTSAT
jgi:hypothetical protein